MLDRTPAFEYDLVPFYCGGMAVANGADPYRVEPLRGCEHAVSATVRNGAKYLVPDPLPAYDQAFFAAFSRLDFGVVRRLWFALECGAFAATVLTLARLLGASPFLVGCALGLADFYCSSLLGQLVPFSMFGLTLAACGLESDWGPAIRRSLVVAAGLLLAMIEPHLGLPAALAVAVWGGRFRLAGLVPLMVLAALSLVAVPLPVALEYVTRVAGAHVLSEINNQDQYGTAYLFHRLGVSEALAGSLASLLYVAALVAAIAFARGAARRHGSALLPFAATALALAGSPFVHLPQMAAAIPAALTIAVRSRSRAASAAVALLAVPWLDFGNVLRVLPVAAVLLFALLRRLVAAGLWTAGALVVAAMCAIVAAQDVATFHPMGEVIRFGAVAATDLPETAWKAIVDAQQHRYTWLADLMKLPTYVALGLVGWAIVRETLPLRRPAGAPAVTYERMAAPVR